MRIGIQQQQHCRSPDQRDFPIGRWRRDIVSEPIDSILQASLSATQL